MKTKKQILVTIIIVLVVIGMKDIVTAVAPFIGWILLFIALTIFCFYMDRNNSKKGR